MKELNKKQKALLDSVKASKTNKGKSKLTAGDKYEIKMTHNGKTIYFVYNDNIYNKGDKNDFLYALLVDADAYESTKNTFHFCQAFGYDYNNKEERTKADRILSACCINADKLQKLFTSAELEILHEIFKDY